MPTATITITIRVRPETHALLDEAARISRQTRNAIAESAIERASQKIMLREKINSREKRNDINGNLGNESEGGK